ncbi:hypothetical protein [Sphingomonas sp. MMS24-J13]|uniref:hypothetical protein n=1 Tax=Sphingomonas sp. MMS24-J13 TaxID=3238686 RepID=UPI003850D019
MRLRTAIMSVVWLAGLASVPIAARDRPGQDPEAELARMLAGRTAGPPAECISRYPTMSSTTIERTGIVYKIGNTLYVSRFEGGCPQLSSFRVLVIKTPSNQLCRGDVADVIETPPAGSWVGSCTFGKFVPYTKAK